MVMDMPVVKAGLSHNLESIGVGVGVPVRVGVRGRVKETQTNKQTKETYVNNEGI